MAVQYFTKKKKKSFKLENYAVFFIFFNAPHLHDDTQYAALRHSSSRKFVFASSLSVVSRAPLSRLPKTKRQRSGKMATLDKDTGLDLAEKDTVFHAKLDEIFPGSLLEGQFVSKAARALKVLYFCILYLV